MLNIHKRYIHEEFDENGVLSAVDFTVPEQFNFAVDVVDEIARLEPKRRAMLWVNDAGEERTFSFSDMSIYSDKAAQIFQQNGIKKGDKVMLILKRHYQFWFCMLALHKLGAVAIPATHQLTKKDLLYRFDAAEVTSIVTTGDGEIASFVEEACGEYHDIKSRFIVNKKLIGWLPFDDLVNNASDEYTRPEINSTDPLMLYFTSGTTGMPKMVVHLHSYPIAHIITAKHWQNVVPDGLHLTLSDTGWAKAAWGKLYGQWLMEAGIFVYDHVKFNPSELLKLFSKYKITTFCAPPTVFRFFIKERLQDYDLSSLTYATIAGEALNPEVYEQFLEHTGLKLMEAFGQTETTCQIINTVNMHNKVGSMGKPNPLYKVELHDENGNSITDGTVGEIVVDISNSRPLGVFPGYYKDEDLTASVCYNGFYHTGDTATRDSDGYFWYVGRIDDIIKSSGYRIGPFEIESVLMEHPSVLECAVTGVPDEIRGQVVMATIVLAPSFTPSDELKAELMEHVKRQTAPYKYPRIIEFVDALPKTISGKIRRTEIRSDYNEQNK